MNATCNTRRGVLLCECKLGYAGDGFTCLDVDECAQGVANCHAFAMCTNLPGAFSCGCKAGYVGDGATCDPLAGVGDTCAAAHEIDAVPFSVTGTTAGSANDYGYSIGACSGAAASHGKGAPDHVFHFKPITSGEYEFALSDQSFDATLYIVKDCATIDVSCVDATDQPCSKCPKSIVATLASGVSYYIVVDGASNSDINNAGQYTFTANKLGESCAHPKTVTSVPFSASGNTAGSKNTLAYAPGNCPGDAWGAGNGSPEEIYSFSPSVTGLYEVKVSANFDAVVYVAESCPSIQTSCVAAQQTACSGCVETLTTELTGGLTYYLVVDGRSDDTPGEFGLYSLSVENVSAAGDTCGSAFVVNSIPFSVIGNTTGATDDYGYSSGACPGESLGWGSGAPDHVYAFIPSVTATYHIELFGQAFDSSLYVVSDCASVNTSCIAAAEEMCSNCLETLTVDLTGGKTYYVIVDGWQPFATTVGGSYTLKIM